VLTISSAIPGAAGYRRQWGSPPTHHTSTTTPWCSPPPPPQQHPSNSTSTTPWGSPLPHPSTPLTPHASDASPSPTFFLPPGPTYQQHPQTYSPDVKPMTYPVGGSGPMRGTYRPNDSTDLRPRRSSDPGDVHSNASTACRRAVGSTNGDEVQCNKCGKIMCNKYVLKVHLRDMHSPRGIHRCQHCPKTYSTINSLRVHVTNTHNKHTSQHQQQQLPPQQMSQMPHHQQQVPHMPSQQQPMNSSYFSPSDAANLPGPNEESMIMSALREYQGTNQ